MSTQTLQPPASTPSLDELLSGEGSKWTSLDNQYDRGFRAGKAATLRDHLGLIMEAAQRHVAKHPDHSTAVAVFVSNLQHVLVTEDEDVPFEFAGGLGI
jgi:hypothetical protein